MTSEELNEMSEQIEDIENEQFGEEGFDEEVKQIAGVEDSLGLIDLAHITAPPPPKV